MHFFKVFLNKLFSRNTLATNETIALFEGSILADSEFYKDVESWGGNKIAEAARA